VTYYFCHEVCRRKFAVEPAAYLAGKREAMAAVPGTTYTCPMDPDVVADKPGPCPKCGMALGPTVPTADLGPDPELADMTRRMVVGFALGVPLLVLSMTDMVVPTRPIEGLIGYQTNLILQVALATPIVLLCGWPFLVRARQSVLAWRPNMFTLIALGVGAAYLYSLAALAYELSGARPVPNLEEHTPALTGDVSDAVRFVTGDQHGTIEPFFESAAWIVILVLVGQVLELRARRRTGDAVRKLVRLAPKTARVVLPDGKEVDLPLELVNSGDVVRVRPGERVPVDGLVKEGTTSIDESMLTGEPVAVGKSSGMKVMAGTQNGLGAITVEAVRVRDDTVLAQVIHLVGQAQRSRVPLQRTVDDISRWFVPLVILAAVLTFAGWTAAGLTKTNGSWDQFVEKEWLTYAVVCAVGVVIIACPCALGLATPMAIVVGTARAAQAGILFRDAAALEKLSAVDTVLVDKTGTLTEGKPWIVAVEGAVGEDPDKVLGLAAALERGSEHPIGAAIVWEAVRRNAPIEVATGVEAVPGKGIRGTVGGKKVAVGTLKFIRESGMHKEPMVSEANSHRLAGRGVVMIGVGDRCVGLVAITDPLRPTSEQAVAKLKREGVRVVLVTGDNVDTANAVSRRLAIEEVVADTLPAEKYAVVKRFQNEGRVVAMAGDGINDAPALAAADVGVALGTGTDVAITAAGVTLVQPDLRAITRARAISRATVKTIRQNLRLAFVYNVLAIPVAAGLLVPLGGGLISPVWAAAAMSLSSVSVILNSLRLTRA
jgi:Cu+-exporting ATPase